MAGPDPDQVKTAQHALEKVAGDWMARRGVVSVEVARRWRDGAPTNEVGIRVTVAKKLPPEDVPAGELLPEELEGVPVDVVEGKPPVPERGPGG
jgi:hypothetical protein